MYYFAVALFASAITGYGFILQNYFLIIIALLAVTFLSISFDFFYCIVYVAALHFWFGAIETPTYLRILSIIYSVIIFFFIAIFQKPGTLYVESKTKSLLTITGTLYMWQLFVNHVIYAHDINVLLNLTARVFAPMCLAIMIYFTIKTTKQIVVFINILLFLMLISAVVALLQFFDVSWAWFLREIQGEFTFVREPCGLSLYSLLLSYQLATIIPISFCMLIKNRNNVVRRFIILFVILCLFFALATVRVRSAIVGVLFGMFFVLLLYKKWKYGIIGLLLVVTLVLIVSYNSPSLFRELTTIHDESAAARIPLFLTAFRIILAYPIFGIGIGSFSSYAEDYYQYVSHLYGAETVLVTSSHNQFLNVWSYFGTPAFILHLVFYYILLKNLIYLYKRSNNKDTYILSLGFIGSQLSYIINSLFHNAGPFISDPYIWFYFGLIFALFKVNRR